MAKDTVSPHTAAAVVAATALRPSDPPRVGLHTKLVYGVGATAFGVKDNGFGFFLLLFYNQVMGLPAEWVSLALMIALVVDSVIDPVIGHVSDRWRSRWGRRHPFMYVAAVPAALFYVLLWNPPALSQEGLLIFIVVTTVVVRTFIALYEIPSAALVAELTSDYNQRTSFFGWRFLFAWGGGLGMTFLAYQVFLRPDAAHPVGQLNPIGYAHYGMAAGALMLVTILASAVGTHRYIRLLKPPPLAGKFSLAKDLREAAVSLSHPSFLALLIGALIGSVATGLAGGLQIYFMTYLWGLNSDQLSLLLLASVIGVPAALISTSALSNWLGKKRSAMVALSVAMAATFGPLALRWTDVFPHPGSSALLPALFTTTAVSVAFAVMFGMLIASMLMDVVEDSELTTGRRSEGLFLAANTFVNKCVSGVGIFAAGLVLKLVDFPAHAKPGEVSELILQKLVFTYVPIQAALCVLVVLSLAGYRITHAVHEDNVRRLAERR